MTRLSYIFPTRGYVVATQGFFNFVISCPGYDGVPVDGMQGLDIGSHPGSTYGGAGVQEMDMAGSDINFDTDMPQPPQDNNQVGGASS